MLLLAVTGVAVALAPPAGAVTNDPLADRQWHLPHVRAPEAWQSGRGEAIVVAVVDSGVSLSHPDLQGQLTDGIDLVDRNTPPDDPNGHGTLVAGILAAVADNGIGVAGVAPRLRVMPVRVLDADGTGRSSDVAEGIRWATDHGADIINVSLAETPGQTLDLGGLITSEVEQAIGDAAEAGVLVIAAAGNEGRDETPYSPSSPALVVGASDRDDRRWSHSSYDADTLFAPGVEIISTWAPDRYASADGTSFAAPVVAAGGAILMGLGLDATQARDRLLGTAVDIGVGAGRVDLAAAVGAQPDTRPAPPPPPPERSPQPDPEPAPPAPVEPPQPLEEPQPITEPPAPPPGTPEPADTSAPASPDEPPETELEPTAAAAPAGNPTAAPSGAAPNRERGWVFGVATLLLLGNLVVLAAVAGRRRR